jgi:hypothetical protein
MYSAMKSFLRVYELGILKYNAIKSNVSEVLPSETVVVKTSKNVC